MNLRPSRCIVNFNMFKNRLTWWPLCSKFWAFLPKILSLASLKRLFSCSLYIFAFIIYMYILYILCQCHFLAAFFVVTFQTLSLTCIFITVYLPPVLWEFKWTPLMHHPRALFILIGHSSIPPTWWVRFVICFVNFRWNTKGPYNLSLWSS